MTCLSCNQETYGDASICRHCGGTLQRSGYTQMFYAAEATARTQEKHTLDRVVLDEFQEGNVPMNKFCTNCGKPLDPDSSFCTTCGAAIGDTSSQGASVLPPPPPAVRHMKRKSRGTVWVVAGSIVAILVVAFAAGNHHVPAGPEEVIRSEEPHKTNSQSDVEIDMVKNGVLSDFNKTTVGKAFEGTFRNPNWSSYETAKGARIVKFTGTMTGEEVEQGGFGKSWTWADVIRQDIPQATAECTEQQAANVFNCIWTKLAKMEIPVSFLFLISADNKSFELGPLDRKGPLPGLESDQNRVLQFVYR